MNPECQEAFECLIKNNLLVDSEKHELLESLQFQPNNLWLKDFYLAKICKQLTSDKPHQGIV